MENLTDIQNQPDSRNLAIDRVGVKNLRYPLRIRDKADSEQGTVATVSMAVDLPEHYKGTHMSRFVEVLNERRGELSLSTLPELLAEVQRRLGAEAAYIEARFPYFLERRAPVSGAVSLMEYPSCFRASRRGEALDFVLEVTVPVKSLCPCSKAISRYGAHNQRSLVTVSARFDGMLWIEDIVEAVEASASSPLYALLKREDEKYVTERAYENPRFVEDLVREVVTRLSARPEIRWLEVQADNQESIHNHSAWALLRWPQTADTPAAREAPAAGPRFGAWLRAQREARHQTQRGLAAQLGVSPSALSRAEQDQKPLPGPAVSALARLWGLEEHKIRVRMGELPEALLDRIRQDPEGFLAWAGA